MHKSFLYFLLLFAIGCSDKKITFLSESDWQRNQNAVFMDATQSPLTPEDLKNFEGLDFFALDSNFVVDAYLERTPDSKWFKMRTTTDRVSEERIYGVLSFKLNGKPFKLNVYQGKENLTTEGLEDYLFLPFLDNTNGETTYSGGRYISLHIPEGDTLTVDFNEAYNPYCAYNERFSCPIVPRVNYMDIKVEAGVKSFKK